MTERHTLPEPECSHADMRVMADVSICEACHLTIPKMTPREGLAAARAALHPEKEKP